MIKFIKIKWKNLLSTGNVFTTVQLDKSPNTLIVGKNGAGKSTLIEAIFFAMFGKPFRNMNKPRLLNSINNKDCVVELEFQIGKRIYLIRRGIKPALFEIYCDGVLVNQDSKSKDYQEYLEKQILQMTEETSRQIMFLGNASFTPFMQLPAAKRREIIEDLLDIQIFSVMNVIVKERIDNIKTFFSNIENEREKINIKKEGIERIIEEKKKNINEAKTNILNDIKNTEDELKDLQDTVSLISQEIISIQKKTDKKSEFDKLFKILDKKETKIQSEIEDINDIVEFLSHNDECPTCKQEINDDFKTKNISDSNDKIDNNKKLLEKIKEDRDSLKKKYKSIEKKFEELSDCSNKLIETNANISSRTSLLKKMKASLDSIKDMEYSSGEDEIKELDELKIREDSLDKEYSIYVEDKSYYDICLSLLKDTGIKTRIIKQYLPIINKLVNKYLAQMDFFVYFELDENFKETIKARHRDEFSYEDFSEGEKQKIDLALLFTWREVAKLKNSLNSNILFLDETFDSSLDSNGTEELMKIINSFGNESNIFVISHRGDILADKFRSVIEFKKVNNFSKIV